MSNIKEDAEIVNLHLKKTFTEQIRNCQIDDIKEVTKALKAYTILTVKLSDDETERYLKSMEYFGNRGIASKAVQADYYADTEVRISNPLKASCVLIDEFVENKSFGGDEKYLAGIFDSASEDLKIACHNFIVQYAYFRTKNMGAVSFLMSKLDPIKGV